MTNVVLGIDIGGTNTVFGLVEKSGNILFKEEISTHGNKPAIHLINHMVESVNSFMKSTPQIELIGVGVGAPNGNHFTGLIQNPPNFNWGQVDIVSILSDKFSCKVKLTNDANAAALGEKRFGIAKDMMDFVMVTLGTGLGSGIISGGRIVYGDDGMAGELGHLSIDQNGRLCSCGLKGCLEMYVSAKGMKITVKGIKREFPDDPFLSSLNSDEIDGKMIDQAVDNGSQTAKLLYVLTADKLAFGLAQAASILNPEAFIFYGGYSQAGDRLLDPTRKLLDTYLMDNLKGKIKLLASGLPHGQAGILGSAFLIWDSEINFKN